MRYFNYTQLARRANITDAHLEELAAIVRRDFPTDEMMFELHMLRACQAIADSRLTIEQALDSTTSAQIGRLEAETTT